MKPSPKLLWLCLLAICAFGAVAASSASAAVDHFTCETVPCTLTGELELLETHTFGTKGSTLSIQCEKANYHATVASLGVTTVTAHPTYEECTTLGAAATVDTTGCNYLLTGETDAYKNTNGVAEGEDATVDLECEGANKIKLTGAGCTLSFGAQNNLTGVKYTNKEEAGGVKDVTIDVTVDNIAYEASGLLCPAAIKGQHTDGFLTQKVTVKGYADNNEAVRVNIQVS